MKIGEDEGDDKDSGELDNRNGIGQLVLFLPELNNSVLFVCSNWSDDFVVQLQQSADCHDKF